MNDLYFTVLVYVLSVYTVVIITITGQGVFFVSLYMACFVRRDLR